MNSEKTISSKVIYEGRAVKFRVDTIELPDGRQTTREIINHDPCVAVVAVDDKDNILLVTQYRTAIEKELLEIPAGCIDPGENPDEAVLREMREETGYLPHKIVRLGGFYATPGYNNEYLYLYLATELEYNPLQAEDTDSIKLQRVPVSKIHQMVMSGKFSDAKSVAGLLLYLEYRKNHS